MKHVIKSPKGGTAVVGEHGRIIAYHPSREYLKQVKRNIKTDRTLTIRSLACKESEPVRKYIDRKIAENIHLSRVIHCIFNYAKTPYIAQHG